jgi:hypothetical protein
LHPSCNHDDYPSPEIRQWSSAFADSCRFNIYPAPPCPRYDCRDSVYSTKHAASEVCAQHLPDWYQMTVDAPGPWVLCRPNEHRARRVVTLTSWRYIKLLSFRISANVRDRLGSPIGQLGASLLHRWCSYHSLHTLEAPLLWPTTKGPWLVCLTRRATLSQQGFPVKCPGGM